ncbi:hypothetical protein AAFF_G00368140 [Aldrovandia affinis]|uniref:AF4/FMR2 C-terminal homology domain-containing protein n=1 Tax=Aldrovandia affinis TaxID=143900 RepID=A0AAD7SH08_9TELE|nr:hypothetical protein AAFF_G00368140 [Aldrovandia affinis]
MAARPSLYNEDRNLLRLRERERRNQEAHQEKELYLENAPLFGEPYKTNKGDELSSRIQRMLGNYEEERELIGNNPHQTPVSRPKNLPPSGSYSRPSRSSHADKTQAPFQNPAQLGAPQSGPPGGSSSQAPKKLSTLEHGQLPSGFCVSPVGRGLGSPDPQQRKSQAWPDLGESASPPHILPTLSPPTEPLSPLHSSDNSDSEPQDPDNKETPRGHRRSPSHGDASHPEAQDIPSQANEGAPLPSQTFPPPLPSKPNLVMPQKPTAYVRPMDGQDQVPSESPDLKPSPEDFHGQSYENLPDLKSNSKPSLSKLKMPPQPIETLPNEAHCVEEILREMTHSWPPPLTAIHTPSTTEPSKFSFPAKESQHVHSAFSAPKRYGSSPKAPSSNCQGPSAVQGTSVVLAHSSGGESASSSDSESTSGSESDSESSESGNEGAPPPARGNPPAPKTDAPTENKWHLHNWIKINQQNSSADSQGDGAQPLSPAPKQQAEEGEASPAKNYKSQTPALLPEFSDNEAKPAQEGLHGPPGGHKSPARSDGQGQRKTVGSKHPSKAAAAPRPEETKPGLRVESVEVVPRDADRTFTERPKVKTKPGREKTSSKTSSKTESKKASKRRSSDRKKPKESAAKEASASASIGRNEAGAGASPSPAGERQPSPPARANAARLEKPAAKSQKKPRGRSPASERKRGTTRKSTHNPPSALVVKIKLSLLSRVPQPQVKAAHAATRGQDAADVKRPETEKGDGDGTPSQVCRKRIAEKEGQTLPRKKAKTGQRNQAFELQPGLQQNQGTGKERDKRKEKKSRPVTQEAPKGPGHKRRSGEAGESGTSRDGGQAPAKHKKSSAKCAQHPKTGKKAPKGFAFPVPAQPAGAPPPSRPLLTFEDRQHPVEYHMKEAKKLKHKADATSDKVGKAFIYLDAAMSFVESGIAMETDPQTPKSAYSMFSETVDLIRFILKLKNSLDLSTPASEKDFTVLCMRCQSLLQMAMFRYKREAALKYSRTLSEHFKNSTRSARAPSPCVSKSMGTPSPMSPMPSPASSASSGPGSNHSGTVTTVAIPQVIQQVASSYVNITALFLSAHDTWEQAEALAQRGSGLLPELDSALGPLSLTSGMSSLVRHTRQGLHWMRLDSNVA